MSDKKHLREGLKGIIETESLSDQQIAALQNPDNSATPVFNQRRRMLLGGSVIAASLLFLTNRAFFQDNESVRQGIVREVLTNHVHIRELDIETGSISELASFFDRLDFSPYLSSRIQESVRLIGGRYCTLQGAIASQLRLVTDSGEVVTYYQARYDREHFGDLPDPSLGQAPDIVYEQGYQMTIWRESNVVNVLTRTAT